MYRCLIIYIIDVNHNPPSTGIVDHIRKLYAYYRGWLQKKRTCLKKTPMKSVTYALLYQQPAIYYYAQILTLDAMRVYYTGNAIHCPKHRRHRRPTDNRYHRRLYHAAHIWPGAKQPCLGQPESNRLYYEIKRHQL